MDGDMTAVERELMTARERFKWALLERFSDLDDESAEAITELAEDWSNYQAARVHSE